MTTIRTTLAALATTALVLVAAPAVAADGIMVPTTSHTMRVEGAWHVGFRAYQDDGTEWVLFSAPKMMQRQCGRGSDTARTCRVAWRGFYNDLRAIRDADPNGPDYWPFPGPPA